MATPGLAHTPESALSFVERAHRAQRIVATVGRAWLGLRTQRWIERNLAPADMHERWHAQHRRNAEDLYAAAVDLKGPILKGAQWLGARPDLRLLMPLGTVLRDPANPELRILTGNPTVLVGLGTGLTVWGIYTCTLLLRDPEALAHTENHPSWTHMYLMMMTAQVGFAVAYVV